MSLNQDLEKQYGSPVLWTGKKCHFGLPLSFTRYILTQNKLITRQGLLNVVEDEVELYKIIDKRVEISFIDQLFGTGTIQLSCKNTTWDVAALVNIRDTRQVKILLDQAVDAQRDRYSVRGKDMIGAE